MFTMGTFNNTQYLYSHTDKDIEIDKLSCYQSHHLHILKIFALKFEPVLGYCPTAQDSHNAFGIPKKRTHSLWWWSKQDQGKSQMNVGI